MRVVVLRRVEQTDAPGNRPNTDNTDCILLGTRRQIEKENCQCVQLGGIDVRSSTTVTYLGESSSTGELTVCRPRRTLVRKVLLPASSARCALSAEAARKRSSTHSSSAAWTIVTAFLDIEARANERITVFLMSGQL